jgi:hypothetical protein
MTADGFYCRAYARWDDPDQRCIAHAPRGPKAMYTRRWKPPVKT